MQREIAKFGEYERWVHIFGYLYFSRNEINIIRYFWILSFCGNEGVGLEWLTPLKHPCRSYSVNIPLFFNVGFTYVESRLDDEPELNAISKLNSSIVLETLICHVVSTL